ncbi:3-carboxy-cis,cis-muconate cycloisomerase [Rhodococcus erythropolis]|uniref:lyase family protein n=1 Tax=Rhodococcus sp. WY5 TaxID=2708349 RepID=UPI000E4A0EA7|nr:lyase family protein [Rhodococcus sp. WY5]RGP45306.1 3-carboxy-cis,cis-muconate cycloisomerase [Rhodococcus erythropolis]
MPTSPSTRGPLFDAVFGADDLAPLVSDRAWIGALLEVEVAITASAVGIGRATEDDAVAVADAAGVLARELDPAELGALAAAGGNPVIPLVKLLRGRTCAPATVVHVGATSQDVMDTALMLLARRTGGRILDHLHTAAGAAADLARQHRATPMIARTLGQQALPTTFGALAATWLTGLDDAYAELERALTALPVQYGGAAGTLAAVAPHGLVFADDLADRLGLARSPLPWHTVRTPVTRLAAALGVAAGAVSKPAADVVLMAMTEIGEVSEDSPGGSSAMPHKRNPVAAISARAAARRVPGLVATILSCADHEFARAAGPWHAEWEPLTDLLRLTGGAAHRLAASLAGLHVHVDALDRNLALTGGAVLAEKVVSALSQHVDDALTIVTDAAVSGTALDEDPRITAHLPDDELAELLDPTRYLGHATDLVDRALDRHEGSA